MNPNPLRAFVAGLPALPMALFALPLVLGLGAIPMSQEGNLRRLDPDEQQLDPNRMQEMFEREFDRSRWHQRLTQADLDQRERSFDFLLKRARFDALARAYLEELAHDPQAGELAWTARLGLRELGRANFPIQGLPGAGPFALDPLGGNLPGSVQRMRDAMKELFAQGGFAWTVPRPDGSAPSEADSRRGRRKLEVEQDSNGARVRITEGEGGAERTRSYPGASLEAILRQYPELEPELEGLQLRVAPGTPLLLRFDLAARGREIRGRRFPAQTEQGLPLVPQELSAPILTDRLGVVVHPVHGTRADELGLAAGTGLVVEKTVMGTYAHLLGVVTGDVLIELDGLALTSGDDIERHMLVRRPEDPLSLVWFDELGQRQEKTWQPGEVGAGR